MYTNASFELLKAPKLYRSVMMTVDDLDDLSGYIAAEANHTEDTTLRRKLDRVFDKCQRLLETYTDEPGDMINPRET